MYGWLHGIKALSYPGHVLSFVAGKRHHLVGMVIGNLLFLYLLLVDGPPSIDDVGQDEWNEDADDGHRGQRELAGTAVDDSQR